MNRAKDSLWETCLCYLCVSSVLCLLIADTAAGQPTTYEGFGAVTRGALDAPGGYQTYHVTSLADDGSPGTLRDAVSQGSRLIVFDAGGTITLTSSLHIRHSYITIDGSSVPSPGITIIQTGTVGTVIEDASDVIIHHLRMDGQGIENENAGDIWGMDGSGVPVSNVIIDHVTAIASTDGVFDMYEEVSDVTISWNLITDTANAVLIKYGRKERISLHHNVFARNSERQPQIADEIHLMDYVNNVVYGWGWNGWGYGLRIAINAEVPSDEYPELNFENNVYHYVSGYSDEDSAIIRLNPNGKVYFNGNIIPAGETDNYDTSTRHGIPAHAEVTKYDASTLGDTVVPFAGTHYPTQDEQNLLDEIRAAIGGGQGHVLSISSTSGGSVTTPGEGAFTYDDGTDVSIGATADDNYHFVNWTGTAVVAGKVANPNAASTTVTVDSAHTLVANFATNLKTLTVSSTSGGSVTAPGEGSFPYDSGTGVSIQATAVSNYHFVNWTGTAASAGKVANANSASTTVTMDADYTLRANFAIDQHSLTTSSSSGGTVTTPGVGTYPYNHGAAASVAATASANYHFVNWTGTAVSSGRVANANAASTTVTMDAAYSIRANFALDQHTLTVSSSTGGSVSSPGEGSFQYDSGTDVSIQASAANNYYFVNWTGTAVSAGKVANPNSASTTVTVDAGYTVRANFGQQDGAAPTVSNLSPASGSIQAPLTSLIVLHVTDAGIGVDADTVEITLDGAVIYTGDTSDYNSATGNCRRTGTPNDYTYAYQSDSIFDFDQLKTVTVNAADIGGVVMNEQSYSFRTEMRSFGQNKQVSSGLDSLSNGRASTACDGSGNIWAVWHAGPAGSRDIYLGKLTAGADTFGTSVRLTSNGSDQLNPAIAIGTDNKLYVVWQDNRRGNWDIYGSTSVNGTSWSAEQRIADSDDNQNYNQVNPAIVVDSNSPSNNAQVAWQDDRAGNQDIYIARSSSGFVTKAVSQITSNTADQTSPAIAVNSANTVYVLWTDARNAVNGTDIYGASGSPWTNVPIVSKAANQSSPHVAVESAGSVLHILWVDQTSGNSDIYYASSSGLPGGPLAGSKLVDDTLNAAQVWPTIAVSGTGGGLKVFTCWQDSRNVSGGTGDVDLYMVQTNSGSGTNVFVGDGGTNSDQTEPAMGVDQSGYPYVVWTDNRGTNPGIYYAGSTCMQSSALVSGLVDVSSGGTIGTADVQNITDVDDVGISVPGGACPYDATISITRVDNPQDLSLPILNGYEFSPSGMEFNYPVTITIPFAVSGAAGTPTAYWYNSVTGALSQQGIDNIEIIEVSPSLRALRFTTTHLTPYYALLGAASDSGGSVVSSSGGGGGGCSLSHSRQGGSMLAYFLPYGALALLIFVLKRRDRRHRREAEEAAVP